MSLPETQMVPKSHRRWQIPAGIASCRVCVATWRVAFPGELALFDASQTLRVIVLPTIPPGDRWTVADFKLLLPLLHL